MLINPAVNYCSLVSIESTVPHIMPGLLPHKVVRKNNLSQEI